MTFPLVDDTEDEPAPPPAGLDAVAERAWLNFTGPDGWEFDVGGLILLESLCRSLSLEARLQTSVDKAEKLSCRGSRMNEVEIPELGSLVKVRQQIAALIRQLKLDEEPPADAGDWLGLDASAKARKAARARWDRRFA